jgi:hypothetical protein
MNNGTFPLFCCMVIMLSLLSEAYGLDGPLRKDSRNPHFFTDNSGKSIFLTGTGIHGTFQFGTYGSPNYSAYLNSMVSYGHNLQRMRIWENGWIRNGGSWLASPMIYKRTGPGLATDGLPKFDLNQFNDTFFSELRNRIVASRDKNIYVMLMFFMSYSTSGAKVDGRDFWGGHPYHSANNINGINGDPNGDGNGFECNTLQIPAIKTLREAYVRRIIDTLNDLDNVFYEVGNELPSSEEFENHIVDFVHAHETTKPKRHAVGKSVGTAASFPIVWDSKEVLFNSPADWVAPAWWGNSDSLNPNPPVDSRKIIFYDTDHMGGWTASQGMVLFPWKAFMRGQNTIFMDSHENPAVSGRDVNIVEAIRRRLGQTLAFSKKVNLVAMRPNNGLCSTTYCLASPGAEYIGYQPGSGAFSVNLVAGTYAVQWFNPATNVTTLASSITVSAGSRGFTPPFSGEAVLYLKASSVATAPAPAPAPAPSPTPSGMSDVIVTMLSYANGIFTCTVKNQGGAATPVGVVVGVGFTVNGTWRAFGVTAAPLSAGASATVVSTSSYTIPNGTHTIEAWIDDVNRFGESNESNNQFSKTITVGATLSTQTPYGGTAWAIPGIIQAENFDVGGEGIAYHDVDAPNIGGAYRASGVDIAGGMDGSSIIGWTKAGEWLEYTVNVAAAGNYTLEARVSAWDSSGKFHVEFNGVDKTGTFTMPVVKFGTLTWTNLTRTVALSAGQQVMRIALDANGTGNFEVANLNYIRLIAPAPVPVGNG